MVRVIPSEVDRSQSRLRRLFCVEHVSSPSRTIGSNFSLLRLKSCVRSEEIARAYAFENQGVTTNGALAKVVSVPATAVQLNSGLGNRRVNTCWSARLHCEAYIHLAHRTIASETGFWRGYNSFPGSSRNDLRRRARLPSRAIDPPAGTSHGGPSCFPALGSFSHWNDD